MKTPNKIISLLAVAVFMIISSCNKANFETGIKGKVEYGEGDCMPSVGQTSDKQYWYYKGDMYFILKSELDKLGNGDFEALRKRSIKDKVANGKLAVALPPETYIVMPEGVYTLNYVVTVKAGEVLSKDFKFWKCTSY